MVYLFVLSPLCRLDREILVVASEFVCYVDVWFKRVYLVFILFVICVSSLVWNRWCELCIFAYELMHNYLFPVELLKRGKLPILVDCMWQSCL